MVQHPTSVTHQQLWHNSSDGLYQDSIAVTEGDHSISTSF